MRDRNAPQKHVWRAEIVLCGRRARHGGDHAPDGQSKTCVWRWQERFMPRRAWTGLLRDKTRPRGSRRSASEAVDAWSL